MKRKILFAASFYFGVLCLYPAFVQAHGNTEEEYIMTQQQPPAELEEKMTTSPSPKHIWIKGHWKWVNRWEWVKGHWVLKPHDEATYVAGHWVKKPNHWLWIPGHWE